MFFKIRVTFVCRVENIIQQLPLTRLRSGSGRLFLARDFFVRFLLFLPDSVVSGLIFRFCLVLVTVTTVRNCNVSDFENTGFFFCLKTEDFSNLGCRHTGKQRPGSCFPWFQPVQMLRPVRRRRPAPL